MRSRLAFLALALALTACAVPPVSSAPAPATPVAVGPSPSHVPATATVTMIPTATATVTDTPTALATEQSRDRCAPGVDSCILAWPFPLDRPIHAPGNDLADASYRYGATQDGAREPHHGVDMSNTFGTPVYAAADGVVVFAGSDAQDPVSQWKNFYGNVVVLEHDLPDVPAPVYTLYGHLSKVEVSVGEAINAGEEIGEVGASGVALGSHLHFEVRLGANDYASTRNPELWLAPAAPLGLPPNSGNLGGEREDGTLAVRAVDSHGNLVPLTLEVQYFADPAGPVTQTFPVEPYFWKEKYPVNSDDDLGENFVLGSLPPGRYRLSFVYWGALYERWVDVAPGNLTFTEFVLE